MVFLDSLTGNNFSNQVIDPVSDYQYGPGPNWKPFCS
jgi:hypothetical protein